MKPFRHTVAHARFSPLEACLLIPITAFLYTLMEWLFIITKASFMNTVPFIEKISVLLNSTAVLALTAILAQIPEAILYYCFRSKTLRQVLRFVLCLTPAVIMACLILLLVDNTTYTAFKFGVVSTKETVRVLYLVGLIVLCLALVFPIFRTLHSIERGRRKQSTAAKTWLPAALGLIIILCAILPVVFNPDLKAAPIETESGPPTGELPNIILITGDGLNAPKMSLYEFTKDTTPFLRDLAGSSLVAENAFSNAQGTIGSTTSILTGRYPADIRVLAATDILKGEDAFQHLPGLLKSYGYYTVQLSFSYYADAYKVNIQDGFDEANGESPVRSKIQAAFARLLPTDHYYFLREEFTRISDRLEHLFYIENMTNPFIQVTESPEKFDDQEKLDYLFTLLDQTDQPLFVHIHWLGTHGPKYYPDEQVFSAGKEIKDQEKYEENFYLDSILEFDRGIQQVYDVLETRGLLDQTVLVVGSDHTQRWSVNRIPLLIHFPNSENAGLIHENVQNLDIAPTLLDYIGAEQPTWMPGQSLLSPLDPDRPIFIAAIPDSKKDPETNKITYPPVMAPYYQFGKLSVVICDRYYQAVFHKSTLKSSQISGYPDSCANPPPDDAGALSIIIEHLQQYGFDTSQLESLTP